MKGHSNFLPCFRVIQDVLGLLENVISIHVFDPTLTPAHPSCIGKRKVAFSKHAESSAIGRLFSSSCRGLQSSAATMRPSFVFFWRDKFLSKQIVGEKKILAKKILAGFFSESWQLAVSRWQLAGGSWQVAGGMLPNCLGAVHRRAETLP